MRVAIIDYGSGNLRSAMKAFERSARETGIAADVLLTTDADIVRSADRIVLPGVGAYADCKAGLAAVPGMIDALNETVIKKSRPFLGICVGMQLLFDFGEEFGTHAGLGIIPGRVRPVPATAADGTPHRIPHIGWNVLVAPAHGAGWGDTILADLPAEPAVYFVHSFAPVPADERTRLADCLYNGCRVSAAIRAGNTYGCQFHPEKSGPTGLRILQNFLKN